MPLTNSCHTDNMIQLGSLRSQSLFQFVQISVFCTLFLTIVFTCCNQLVSNLVNLGATDDVGYILKFFCNNSMAACVRRTFQVSQISVETLFRWGGKRFTWFCNISIQERVYQISSKLCKIYRRYCKKHLVSLTLDTL